MSRKKTESFPLYPDNRDPIDVAGRNKDVWLTGVFTTVGLAGGIGLGAVEALDKRDIQDFFDTQFLQVAWLRRDYMPWCGINETCSGAV